MNATASGFVAAGQQLERGGAGAQCVGEKPYCIPNSYKACCDKTTGFFFTLSIDRCTLHATITHGSISTKPVYRGNSCEEYVAVGWTRLDKNAGHE